jgi:hypothetical protein
MMTPGTPPIPHVGGPVSLGSTGVLIGGQPAARMGDMCVCVGPPDSVALGCMTVLIGEAGGGGGGGGGGGAASGASAANASAAVAQQGNLENTTKREHWVEFQFVDKAGLPVSGVPYKFTDPAGKESEGVLRTDGRVVRDALMAGQCAVKLYGVSNAQWSKNRAEVGEKVKMTADVQGFEDKTPVTIQVFRRDIHGADRTVAAVEVTVRQGKIEGEWTYQVDAEEEAGPPGLSDKQEYSAPEYYFDVLVERCKATSGVLGFEDWIDIRLKDAGGKPMGNVKYRARLPNGEIRKGVLDGRGCAKLTKVPAGKIDIQFERKDVYRALSRKSK